MIRKTLLWSALGFAIALACDGEGMEEEGGGTGGTEGVPAPYAGKSNPVEGDSAAIAAGETTYMSLCLSCHGEAGLGDGPSNVGYDPPATNFTTSMQPDDYMLWTISEGVEDNPGMVAYKAQLDESQIWEVVSYIRTLQ